MYLTSYNHCNELRPTDEAKNGLENLDMPEKTKLPNNCEIRRKFQNKVSHRLIIFQLALENFQTHLTKQAAMQASRSENIIHSPYFPEDQAPRFKYSTGISCSI